MNYFLIALIIIGLIGLVVVIEIFNTRCPACKKFRARTIVKGHSHSDYTTYEHDYTVTRGTRLCKCKFCGHEWTQRYSRRRKR